MRRGFGPTHVCRGFTLLETLIVLGILLGLVSLSWPSLRNQLNDSHLLNAAKDIRSQLARARIEAMESGIAQQFRYQVRGNFYEISPLSLAEIATASRPESLDFLSPQDEEEIDPIDFPEDEDKERLDSASHRIQHSLPDRIFFADSSLFKNDNDLLQQPPGSIDREFEEAGFSPEPAKRKDPLTMETSLEVIWSEPIIFQPNGRTSDARIRLLGQDGKSIEITLRGLTGMAKVGKLRREETGQ